MLCRQLVVILAYVGRRSSVRPIFVMRSRFDCNFACSVASDGDDGKKLALSESYWQSWLHLMCYYAWGLTGACWVLHRLLWFEQHASESGGGKQQRYCFLNDVWYAYGIQSDEHACIMGQKINHGDFIWRRLARRKCSGAPRSDCPAFVSRFASGFNDTSCENLLAQQQGDDVRFH